MLFCDGIIALYVLVIDELISIILVKGFSDGVPIDTN